MYAFVGELAVVLLGSGLFEKLPKQFPFFDELLAQGHPWLLPILALQVVHPIFFRDHCEASDWDFNLPHPYQELGKFPDKGVTTRSDKPYIYVVSSVQSPRGYDATDNVGGPRPVQFGIDDLAGLEQGPRPLMRGDWVVKFVPSFFVT